ncbi:hypothetical protein PHYSODRAFT_471805 [Phytophthora sojae]|uniref:PiggyBac transposable element-derived protein 4 C-terminal zinc-ribbon domain-containing protein n=1 Tax=Phytophthora sojae (strain P6497) TaxID=1094619 RepID=G4YMY4_PHYSP|nr:hypothetical protein PHYSODRAFT_471805 [Phytophthora sojae]EGZ29517.1 hypothetical protein PHYSODRAFT_471805 [Phytophthora sojae]|eukprot:XP_009516792.1 hypothetical protein PHYSODRAFT_471805 [Phytophthora sojae]
MAPLQKDHEPVECPDWQIVNGVRKRRQRQCKACSILKRKVGERCATKYYCAACSKSDTARYVVHFGEVGDVYLTSFLQFVPKHYPGNSMTCFLIWHNKWENGRKRPHPRCGRDIQARAASTGGDKKRKRQDSEEDAEEKEDKDEEQEASEE